MASAGWNWDHNELSAWTSYSSLVPLFYIVRPDLFAVSPSLLFLRERFSSGALDWPAITVLLVTGHYLDDETPFADIRAIPLRATLTWTESEFTIDRDRDPPPSQPNDFEHAVIRYQSLLDRAIERDLPTLPYTMGLSGGTDSRHILLTLLNQGREPAMVVTSNHYLSSSSADTEIAAELGKRVGVAVQSVDPCPDRFRSEIAKNLAMEFLSLKHSWATELARALARYPRLYDGLSGGILFGTSPLTRLVLRDLENATPSWPGAFESVLAGKYDANAASLLDTISNELINREHIREGRSRYEAAFEAFASWPNPARAFDYFNLNQRSAADFTYQMMRNAEVVCPLDSPELVDLGLGLPWDVSTRDDLQDVAIRRFYPELSDIPFVGEYTPRSKNTYFDTKRELQTITQLLTAIRGSDTSVLTPNRLQRMTSDEFRLIDIQRMVYVWQLLALVEGHATDLS